MWKELQKSPPFFLLFLKSRMYHILVTDYIKIWEVNYSEDEFLTRLKESNFGLDMDKNELLDKGLQLLQRPSELKNLKISVVDHKLSISMSMVFGFPLKLTFNLQEGSQELFFQKVTQPALKTIKDLRSSEQELRKLLMTKDDEIEEYKSFGGKIRYTAIPPYNDEAHLKKHCAYDVIFGDAEISSSVLERITDTLGEDHIIKEEKNDVRVCTKVEPRSQDINGSSIADTATHIRRENVKNEVQPLRKRRLNI